MDRPNTVLRFIFLLSITSCTDDTPIEESPEASLPGQPLLIVPDSPETESYTVSWTSSLRASSYTLEEAENPAFLYSRIAYSVVDTFITITGKHFGNFLFYRVRADNDAGSSDWSPTKYVIVQYPVVLSTSFENDTAFTLDGWHPAFNDTSTISFSREVPAGGGSFSLAVWHGWYTHYVKKSVPLPRGSHRYLLSCWSKVNPDCFDCSAYGVIWLFLENAGSTNSDTLAYAIVRDSIWTLYALETDSLSPLGNDSLVVVLWVYGFQFLYGTVLFDLVRLEVIGDDSSESALFIPGFLESSPSRTQESVPRSRFPRSSSLFTEALTLVDTTAKFGPLPSAKANK